MRIHKRRVGLEIMSGDKSENFWTAPRADPACMDCRGGGRLLDPPTALMDDEVLPWCPCILSTPPQVGDVPRRVGLELDPSRFPRVSGDRMDNREARS